MRPRDGRLRPSTRPRPAHDGLSAQKGCPRGDHAPRVRARLDPTLTNRLKETMKAPMEAHKYFAFLTLFCMAMTIIPGHGALRK